MSFGLLVVWLVCTGEVVFRQGDVGSSFYIVVHGEVEVSIGGEFAPTVAVDGTPIAPTEKVVLNRLNAGLYFVSARHSAPPACWLCVHMVWCGNWEGAEKKCLGVDGGGGGRGGGGASYRGVRRVHCQPILQPTPPPVRCLPACCLIDACVCRRVLCARARSHC